MPRSLGIESSATRVHQAGHRLLVQQEGAQGTGEPLQLLPEPVGSLDLWHASELALSEGLARHRAATDPSDLGGVVDDVEQGV